MKVLYQVLSTAFVSDLAVVFNYPGLILWSARKRPSGKPTQTTVFPAVFLTEASMGTTTETLGGNTGDLLQQPVFFPPAVCPHSDDIAGGYVL